MGTRYRILLHTEAVSAETTRQVLADVIGKRLNHLDKSLMSTYEPTSQLSVVNAMPVGQTMVVANELIDVISTAITVHEQSLGAFDITIKPLVDLWGFGPDPGPWGLPDEKAIAAALAQMGMNKLLLDRATNQLSKSAPVSLDLSAIAKGYAVDEVASILEAEGIGNYLVEIGGEIVSQGNRPDGSSWRLGIETPSSGESLLFQAIQPGNAKLAMAGSGNYRNFFLVDGQRYSHTINPVTGRPVTHDLAAVTVVAHSAMLADAWATALMVMGTEAGMKRANELQLAAFFIEDEANGFKAFHTEAFSRFLPDNHR
jgi:thiamine biosynthesis lipoprotein